VCVRLCVLFSSVQNTWYRLVLVSNSNVVDIYLNGVGCGYCKAAPSFVLGDVFTVGATPWSVRNTSPGSADWVTRAPAAAGSGSVLFLRTLQTRWSVPVVMSGSPAGFGAPVSGLRNEWVPLNHGRARVMDLMTGLLQRMGTPPAPIKFTRYPVSWAEAALSATYGDLCAASAWLRSAEGISTMQRLEAQMEHVRRVHTLQSMMGAASGVSRAQCVAVLDACGGNVVAAAVRLVRGELVADAKDGKESKDAKAAAGDDGDGLPPLEKRWTADATSGSSAWSVLNNSDDVLPFEAAEAEAEAANSQSSSNAQDTSVSTLLSRESAPSKNASSRINHQLQLRSELMGLASTSPALRQHQTVMSRLLDTEHTLARRYARVALLVRVTQLAGTQATDSLNALGAATGAPAATSASASALWREVSNLLPRVLRLLHFNAAPSSLVTLKNTLYRVLNAEMAAVQLALARGEVPTALASGDFGCLVLIVVFFVCFALACCDSCSN
jgi:hypothetical protein